MRVGTRRMRPHAHLAGAERVDAANRRWVLQFRGGSALFQLARCAGVVHTYAAIAAAAENKGVKGQVLRAQDITEVGVCGVGGGGV